MQKCLVIFFLLMPALYMHGQSEVLLKKIAGVACDCFENAKDLKDLRGESFLNCIFTPLEEDSTLIKAECFRIYGDSTEETSYQFGVDLVEKLKISLVDDCYAFFSLMDTLRQSALTGLNEDSLRKELNWFNSRNKAPDSSIFYSDRGILKLQLKDTTGAYYDLHKAVQLKDDNISAHLFRGWTMEIKKDYDGAIKDFEFVANATGDSNYLLLAAIVKRKKRIAQGIKK